MYFVCQRAGLVASLLFRLLSTRFQLSTNLTTKVNGNLPQGAVGMERRYVGLAVAGLVVAGAVLTLPSCGHDQKLQSIQIQPATVTFQTPQSVSGVLKAYGTYIHPPATKDITAEVTWATDAPQMLILTPTTDGEQVGPNGICGVADVSATAPEGTGGADNIVVGYATMTIDGSQPTCPGATSTDGEVVVTPAGTGTGTVVSAPTGISCPGTACGALFAPGTIILTATPGPNSTFGGWQQCPSGQSSNQCTITVAAGGFINVIATFTAQ